MWALDRPRFDITNPDGTVTRGSCTKVATSFCKATCYNNKLEKVFTRIRKRDVKNETFWQQLTGATFRAILKRKRRVVARFRGMTRGENFSSHEDVWRWSDILKENPDTLFWLPTRAWWDPEKQRLNLWQILEIEAAVMSLPNARVQASVDPSNIAGWAAIEARGWGVMFYGDDNPNLRSPSGLKAFHCPKTFRHLKGHCGICRAGCFDKDLASKRFVHLKQH
ncbi:hypothetical protein P409_00650 [Inquilinus limosus MP06]|uniref:Gene product 88 domain-containing protein n=2 Tax=Inquilinus limosus TaxID=171674 RepID=A0A0A0DDK0_9PROT|nr:hypothetical protein P409_00650 [Inquilinus limosus MP06]